MFNPNARQCVEFNYHSCGEDREGYNVFATELECVSTCLHKGIIHDHYYYTFMWFDHDLSNSLHTAADGGNYVT